MTPALLFPLVFLVTSADQAPKIQANSTENSVLRTLTDEGVTMGPMVTIPMMKPLMTDGMTEAEQYKVLEELSGPRRNVPALTRKSRVAPFVSKNENIMTPDPVPDAMSVNVYFVAHGPFEALTQKGFLKDLMGGFGGGNKGLPSREGQLQGVDLTKRNLETVDDDGNEVRYAYNTFTLLDRVYINSVRRIVASRSDDSLVVAATIEKRLSDDPDYPNTWQSVEKDPITGQPTKLDETKHPHEAAGFYLKATKLKNPAGAIFVEYHHLYHVPQGWFNGAPLLRAKIPTIANDTVKKFRTQLESAQVEN